jgi:hypothetical protein
MWSQVSGGQVLRVLAHPIPLVIGDTQYPKNIFTLWSKAELKAIGIMPYREAPVDTKYHYSGTVSYEIKDDEVVGSYASQSDKEYAQLKLAMLERTKATASSLLARDDWMAVRASEGGTAIPDAVKAYRVAVRKESNDKETAIKALGDLDAVKLYEATPYIETRKKEIYADDGSVSYGDEYESERHLDLVNHYFAEDPLAKDDPAFVSLVKK